jgi:hypothetical protein
MIGGCRPLPGNRRAIAPLQLLGVNSDENNWNVGYSKPPND